MRSEWINDVTEFLERAGNFKAQLDEASELVLAEAIREVDKDLMAAKLRLIGTLHFLNETFKDPPRNPKVAEKERLILLVSFAQGAGHVEELIGEGQYIKACAVIRQDFEFLTRMCELRKGTARIGKRPEIRNAPEGSQRFYGQLSKIAHPETPALLLNFIQTWEDAQKAQVISHIPRFVSGLANYLFMIHAWLAFEFAREGVFLYAEMFGRQDAIDRAAFEVTRASWSLETAGLVFLKESDAPRAT